jgi:hypothetical protein
MGEFTWPPPSQSPADSVLRAILSEPQAVPRLAYGEKVPRPRRIVFELASQLGDMGVYCACDHTGDMSPHFFEQFNAGDNGAVTRE